MIFEMLALSYSMCICRVLLATKGASGYDADCFKSSEELMDKDWTVIFATLAGRGTSVNL